MSASIKRMPPDEAKERAAVAWWIKRHKPHLKHEDFSKAFDQVMSERGDDFNEAVSEHKRHLATQERKGISSDETEQPLDSLINADSGVKKLKHKIKVAKVSAEQAKSIIIPWGDCPKCGSKLRGTGGIRCYTCKPAGDPNKYVEKVLPLPKKQPEINGKTFGETWESLKPMDLTTPEITPIEAELAKLEFDELREVFSGANLVMNELLGVPKPLRLRVVQLITEHLRAT